MISQGSKTLKLVGCIALEDGPVGFALPLFASPVASILMIQVIDELSAAVSGFKAFLNEEGGSSLIAISSATIVGIGDPQLYVFLDGANAHVGSLGTLRPTLASFTKENSGLKSLVLQISELIGTDQEKKVARLSMRALLLERQGPAAAYSFYEGSALRSALWKRLLQASADRSMAQRILSARAKISAKITDSGAVQLDLTALTREDRAEIDESSIVSGILSEFDPNPAGGPDNLLDRQEANRDTKEVQEKADVLVQRITRTGRQEERIALLMAAILSDPAVGKSVLLQYQNDRAKTAAWALKELRRTFIETNWSSYEHVIGALIPKLFTQQWPMTRGDLLFYLAKHLAKWPQVNASIRKSLENTRSAYVDLWRKEIQEKLGQPRSTEQV